jgi:hypothetical protein
VGQDEEEDDSTPQSDPRPVSPPEAWKCTTVRILRHFQHPTVQSGRRGENHPACVTVRGVGLLGKAPDSTTPPAPRPRRTGERQQG